MKALSRLIYDAGQTYGFYTAIKEKEGTLSYSDFNRSALSIASFLSYHGLVYENIGILGQRRLSAFQGVLGALYAGCAYVPINSKLPEEKVRFIIEETDIRVLIGSERDWSAMWEKIPRDRNECIILPDAKKTAEENHIRIITVSDFSNIPQLDRPVEPPPEQHVYIMYTSGSTGKPKGVPLSNTNVVCFLEDITKLYTPKAGFRASQTYDLSFDVSVTDMFFTWMNGGTLCVLSQEELLCPSEYIKREKIEFWNSVPTIAGFMNKLDTLNPNEFPSLRFSLFCGEPLKQSVANKWQLAAPNSTVENVYGPTEATVFVTRYRYSRKDHVKAFSNGIVPIGQPLPRTEMAIVDDEHNRISGGGTVGELAIKGRQVAEGYLNDKEKTKRAFVKMPWEKDGGYWYKTGDSAFYNEKGDLECLGRKDTQIKITGRRVEISEIEFHLSRVVGSDVIVSPYRDDHHIVCRDWLLTRPSICRKRRFGTLNNNASRFWRIFFSRENSSV